jgi:SAM-dependent methyltransferase
MRSRVRPDVFWCEGCRLWSSEIAAAQDKSGFDEASREAGLAALRRRNYETIGTMLEARRPLAGLSVLEVGSAHGWFLGFLSQRGARVVGIEPDREIAEIAAAVAPTRVGYFPAALVADELFDAIVFNDVLEHVPDVLEALDVCRRHLAPGGLLVVNLPLSGGILYRTSIALASVGAASSFDRMWQRGFPSPHLWYFDRNNLVRLAEQRGFALESFSYLETMLARGLWSRLGMARVNPVKRAALFIGLVAVYPFVKWILPGDIGLFLFRVKAA